MSEGRGLLVPAEAVARLSGRLGRQTGATGDSNTGGIGSGSSKVGSGSSKAGSKWTTRARVSGVSEGTTEWVASEALARLSRRHGRRTGSTGESNAGGSRSGSSKTGSKWTQAGVSGMSEGTEWVAAEALARMSRWHGRRTGLTGVSSLLPFRRWDCRMRVEVNNLPWLDGFRRVPLSGGCQGIWCWQAGSGPRQGAGRGGCCLWCMGGPVYPAGTTWGFQSWSEIIGASRVCSLSPWIAGAFAMV